MINYFERQKMNNIYVGVLLLGVMIWLPDVKIGQARPPDQRNRAGLPNVALCKY